MAGPAKQVMGEVIRPRFNVYTIMDHALGGYERGEDGLYYLNGGFAHIMGFSGRGNTFKSTLMDFCIFQIMLRYRAAWGSKYDTEMSTALDRLEMGFRSAMHATGADSDESVLSMIDAARYNLVDSATLPGEEYYAGYIRDEVEGRFTQYAKKSKECRETPFRDPVRRANKMMVDPWIYSIDSLSEFHTGDIEGKHAKTEVGDKEQNILNAHDSLQKSNMMGRWPTALARGHMFMAFSVHLADDMSGAMKGNGGANDKLLDDIGGDLKFSNVPRRAISFLTNSLIVATRTGELKQDSTYNAKTGVNEPMYPTARSRTMNSSSNDLKIIRYTQFRAKGGPTGVKFDLIFSQKQGLFYHLTLWHYISQVLKTEFGYTRSGANYELHILPGVKFMRTTIRDQIDEDPRLRRALEITAAIAYMHNNWHDLDLKYVIDPTLLYSKIVEKGWDWNEIMDNTVEYWMFKDQETKGGKRTLTAMSLLAMAVDDDCNPKFLTRKK